jgi:hypothetical protein
VRLLLLQRPVGFEQLGLNSLVKAKQIFQRMSNTQPSDFCFLMWECFMTLWAHVLLLRDLWPIYCRASGGRGGAASVTQTNTSVVHPLAGLMHAHVIYIYIYIYFYTPRSYLWPVCVSALLFQICLARTRPWLPHFTWWLTHVPFS